VNGRCKHTAYSLLPTLLPCRLPQLLMHKVALSPSDNSLIHLQALHCKRSGAGGSLRAAIHCVLQGDQS